MMTHERDTDCTLDSSDTCTGCGVYHGEPCPDCQQRGYHVFACRTRWERIARLSRSPLTRPQGPGCS
ncbi:MAG TPA: hypothetical protein VM285_05685 [Polyangia bacterium]|nr:hypothetical protein [Polyangia bacterium]